MITQSLYSRGPRASRRRTMVMAAAVMMFAATSQASVIEFTDRAEWQAAVGHYTTIDFVLPPTGTPITDQYSDLGVTFGGWVVSHASGSYQNDGWGLRGIQGGAWAYFDSPQLWLGLDYPGLIKVDFFLDDTLLYTSTFFDPTGTGNFAGFLLPFQFDSVYMYREEGYGDLVAIDDLYFGVPAPGALGLLLIAGWIGPRRRRG